MYFKNKVELYEYELKQAEEYVSRLLSTMDDKIILKTEYIYEIHYRDIRITNKNMFYDNLGKMLDNDIWNSISSSCRLETQSKNKTVEDIEKYLLIFKEATKKLMLDDYLKVVSKNGYDTFEIKFHSRKKNSIENTEDSINREKITYIKFLYGNHIWEMNLKNCKVVYIRLFKVIDTYEDEINYLMISGYFYNNSFENGCFIKEVEKNRFLEITQHSEDSDGLMVYHNINDDKKYNIFDLIEIINAKKNVDNAIRFTEYEGKIIIRDSDYIFTVIDDRDFDCDDYDNMDVDYYDDDNVEGEYYSRPEDAGYFRSHDC